MSKKPQIQQGLSTCAQPQVFIFLASTEFQTLFYIFFPFLEKGLQGIHECKYLSFLLIGKAAEKSLKFPFQHNFEAQYLSTQLRAIIILLLQADVLLCNEKIPYFVSHSTLSQDLLQPALS